MKCLDPYLSKFYNFTGVDLIMTGTPSSVCCEDPVVSGDEIRWKEPINMLLAAWTLVVELLFL